MTHQWSPAMTLPLLKIPVLSCVMPVINKAQAPSGHSFYNKETLLGKPPLVLSYFLSVVYLPIVVTFHGSDKFVIALTHLISAQGVMGKADCMLVREREGSKTAEQSDMKLQCLVTMNPCRGDFSPAMLNIVP